MNPYISKESLIDNDFFYYTEPNFYQKKCKKTIPYPNEEDNNLRCLNEVDKPNTFRLRNSEIDYINTLNYLNKNHIKCRKNINPIKLNFNNSLSVSQESTNSSVSQESTNSSVSQESTNSSVSQESTNSSVSQESTNSSVSQESTNLSVSQESTNSSVSQESTNLSVSQESTNSSVSQESTNLSVSQESTNSSVSQESTNSSVSSLPIKDIYYTVPQSFDTALYSAKLAKINPEKLINKNYGEKIIFDRNYEYSTDRRNFVDDIIENENLILTIVFIIICIYIFR